MLYNVVISEKTLTKHPPPSQLPSTSQELAGNESFDSTFEASHRGEAYLQDCLRSFISLNIPSPSLGLPSKPSTVTTFVEGVIIIIEGKNGYPIVNVSVHRQKDDDGGDELLYSLSFHHSVS